MTTKQKWYKIFSVSVQLHLKSKWHKWSKKKRGRGNCHHQRNNSHHRLLQIYRFRFRSTIPNFSMYMVLSPRFTTSSSAPLFPKKETAREKPPWIPTTLYFTFKNPESARHEVSISDFWITLSFRFESSSPAPRRGEEL